MKIKDNKIKSIIRILMLLLYPLLIFAATQLFSFGSSCIDIPGSLAAPCPTQNSYQIHNELVFGGLIIITIAYIYVFHKIRPNSIKSQF